MSSESTINVSDFVPQLTRQVELPNGNKYPALWLDDISIDALNTMVSEEQAAKGMEAFETLRRHIKLLVPSITDADLGSLTIRQLPLLCADLKTFEAQTESDRPLESAPSSSAPEASSL